MEKAHRLVFENNDGQVVRTFHVRDLNRPLHVVQSAKTRRLELVEDVESLTIQKIKFKDLGVIRSEQWAGEGYQVQGFGRLRLVQDIELVKKDVVLEKENSRRWLYGSLIAGALLIALLLFFVGRPVVDQKIEQELKQTIVQIAKSVPKPINSQNLSQMDTQKPQKITAVKSGGVKRMGALAALGSLSSGKQKGGLNLGAAQTSAGVGMGGSQGSGGVQTNIYARGLTSAALGSGGQVQGAGGYGTKGKGGGQAGYGTMSLVGSAEGMSVPVNEEANVGGGLDRDMIAAVINKNMGQVRFCYEQGLVSQPSLAGRVALNFTISGQGTVKFAEVANSSLGSKLVEDCIVMRLRSWKFPVPIGGVDVKVTYPFVLRRAGQG